MSRPVPSLGPKDADTVLSKANLKASERDFAAALELYIKAAEIYLDLARRIALESSIPSATRTELASQYRRKASGSIERAKQIKNGTQTAPTLPPPRQRGQFSEEQQFAVIDASSRVNRKRLPLWTAPPEDGDRRSPGPFVDPDGLLSLSDQQTKALASWQRPTELYRADVLHMLTSDMQADDIAQSYVTDCSVVTALVVCWNHHCQFGSKLCLSSLYPQGPDGMPVIRADGHYTYRLMFNGAYRQIVIDDLLPVDRDGRPMCTTATNRVLWPSLVEKAYLKAHGGYDFPGSTSGVDIHALTGWIPEQIDLKASTVQRGKLWSRILRGFRSGDCIITLGTGKSISESWLIPSHSYAVIGLNGEDGERLLNVLNPWPLREPDLITQTGEMGLGHSRSHWFDLDAVCDTFSTLYVNWRPEIFAFTQTIHGNWRQAKHQHIRFGLTEPKVDSPCMIPSAAWGLLTRHTTHKEDSAFINLNILKIYEGEHILRDDLLSLQNVFTNGINTLVQTEVDSKDCLLHAVLSKDTDDVNGGTPRPMSWTLTIYTQVPLTLIELADQLPYHQKIDSEFDEKSAGGNWTSRSFMRNPQYALEIKPHGEGSIQPANVVRLTMEASRNIPLGAKVLYGGRRITDIKQGDVLLDTGPYAYGVATGEAKIKPGRYTLVSSTYRPGQLGRFSLSIESSGPIALTEIPQEGSGMFSKVLKGAWKGASAAGGTQFGNYHHNPRYEIILSRTTDFQCRLQVSAFERAQPSINVTMFKDDQDGSQVLTTGPYTDALCGASCDPVHLEGPGIYIAVLSTFDVGIEADFELSMYSSSCPITATVL